MFEIPGKKTEKNADHSLLLYHRNQFQQQHNASRVRVAMRKKTPLGSPTAAGGTYFVT